MTTTTFMTNDEYAQFKGKDDMDDFNSTGAGYPNATALNLFRESVWGWMTGFIGNTEARATYDSNDQFKLRDIEYRAVEMLISGEIAKNKIENYIANSIIELFGETDKGEVAAVDEGGNRGVVEG